jgi:hypothetical protein
MTSLGPAEIVDVGPESLAIVHRWPAEKGQTFWIEFPWAGFKMRLNCEVRVIRPVPESTSVRSGCTVVGGQTAEEFKKRVEAALANAPV